MDLPSTRELELEALVRQRDGQVSELNVSLVVPPGPPAFARLAFSCVRMWKPAGGL